MNKSYFICLFAIIIAFIAGLKTGQPNDLHTANYNTLSYKIKLLQAYGEYDRATEELLDSLNNKYNWVDGFDPQSYYESRAKVDSLLNLEDK